MAQRGIVQRRLVSAIAFIGLTGCSSITGMLEPDRIDYKSAKQGPSTLEVPPDLTQLQRDNRYALSNGNRGVATASDYNAQQAQNTGSPAVVTKVAPNATPEARIEKIGNQRWLVVKQSPEALWPQIKDFWQDSGFLINLESPETGIMETDWAENRAKIPQDIFRSIVGKALDTLYSTGERDKFRTRLERTADGGTEVYISHRGAQEELVGSEKDSSVWTPRPADPELEAEFLSRLLSRLGVEEVRAKAAVRDAGAQPITTRARLVKNADGSYVTVDESFDRAWRRVGLALDRVGFTVEDRDRSKGLYYVRYVDQDEDAQTKAQKEGLLSKLFTFGSKNDKARTAQRYQILVKPNNDGTQVAVLNNEGRTENSSNSQKILGLLNEQLK
jgi:outer membrane protein assembly factor BamC